MEDNESATAKSGAAAPENGADTKKAAATQVDTAHQIVETLKAAEADEEYRDSNAALRRQFLDCNRRIKEAQAAGDAEAEEQAKWDRERIGTEFVEKNVKLVVHNASSLLIGDHDARAEVLAGAWVGFWEAFAGVDPAKVGDVIVDEDGNVHAASGWDPDKGTFATYAGTYISGQARRTVRRSEAAYTGMSYNTWSEKPKVDRARRELTETLGRVPTHAEIAAHAGVTVATVSACSTATPVSLQTLVSDDGSTTLGDMLADTTLTGEEPFELSAAAEEELVARARQMSTLDLMVLVLRKGLTGRHPLTVNRTADKLCVGRGAAQLAIKRALSALVPEKTVPQTVECAKCDETLAYDWDNEPQLELTEFDVPEGLDDLTLEQHRAVMAQWTEKVNAAHAAEQESYDTALVAYRTKAREAAEQFRTKHRRHDPRLAAEDEESADLAASLA